MLGKYTSALKAELPRLLLTAGGGAVTAFLYASNGVMAVIGFLLGMLLVQLFFTVKKNILEWCQPMKGVMYTVHIAGEKLGELSDEVYATLKMETLKNKSLYVKQALVLLSKTSIYLLRLPAKGLLLLSGLLLLQILVEPFWINKLLFSLLRGNSILVALQPFLTLTWMGVFVATLIDLVIRRHKVKAAFFSEFDGYINLRLHQVLFLQKAGDIELRCLGLYPNIADSDQLPLVS